MKVGHTGYLNSTACPVAAFGWAWLRPKRRASLSGPETAIQVLVPAHQDWFLSMLVSFQFSETFVIFQDILHISTVALLLVHTQFPLEVSGQHHLASGRGLILGLVLFHCLHLGWGAALTSPCGPQGEGPLCPLVLFCQSSKFVPSVPVASSCC